MAYIKIEQIQKYADKLENWLSVGESPATECLVIQFEKEEKKLTLVTEKINTTLSTGEMGVDLKNINDCLINNTLYLQSRNGNVSIDFDESGLIKYIEIS